MTFSGPMITVLAFHGVGTPQRPLEPGEAPLWVEPDRFTALLDVAAQNRERVALTFDDGNKSDIEYGLPALLSRGLTARFFVIAGRLDQPGSLSRADLATLRESGMSVGSHGMEHLPWRGMPASQLRTELVDARRIIEDAIGEKVEHVACPRGSYDYGVLRALRQCGYEQVVTSDGGRARRDAWLQARNSLSVTDDPASVETLVRAGEGVIHTSIRATKKLAKRWR